jgi:dihydrolipoamide dehydrogenase
MTAIGTGIEVAREAVDIVLVYNLKGSVMERKVGVAVIGAGTAGINAVSVVREVTDDFVLINGGPLGTTCARVGCMPSKVMIQIADDFHRRHVLATEGIDHGDELTIDVSSSLARVRALRDRFVGGIIEDVIKPLGDRFIEGYAEFIEPTLLQVGEMKIRATKTVIAAGSRPAIPQRWRHFGERILTTDTIFEQSEFPRDMAVLGLGVIGLELGQALARIGLNVTGFDLLTQIGGLQDPEVNKVAVEAIGKDFPMNLEAKAQIEEADGRLRVTSGSISALVDKILLSVGRISNADGLRLDRLGLEVDSQGLPPFDRETMQIDDLPIFIAGDVNNYRPVLHEASHEGTVAGHNVLQERVVRFKRKPRFVIAFTDPNICAVGASWQEIKDKAPAIGKAHFDGGREVIMLRDQGIIRIYGDSMSGRLWGAEMVAPGGEHLAHLLAWSIQQELTVFDLLAMPFYHPAVEETLYTALKDLASQVQRDGDGAPMGFETV